jgi:hypothetical protein
VIAATKRRFADTGENRATHHWADRKSRLDNFFRPPQCWVAPQFVRNLSWVASQFSVGANMGGPALPLAYRKFCKKRFPLPSEERVAALEQRIGIALPPDYRRFILGFNGGIFNEPEIVPPSAGCPLDWLTDMYGIGASNPHAELASKAHLALFDDNDPPQILPIGYTLMGNLLFLVTHSEKNGSIGLKKAGSDDSFFLAARIEEFFGLLREPPDDGE